MASRVELYRIYISGLSPYVLSEDLEFEFAAFGNIYYFHFHGSQGYTLISYTNQWDAILAIANGNNMVIGGFPIKVQWARGWPKDRNGYKEYDCVFNESFLTNCTVYCCYLSNTTTIDVLQNIFCPFGVVEEIYTKNNFSDHALIRYKRKIDATVAICTIDGVIVGDRIVSCEWSNRPIHQLVASGWKGTRLSNKEYLCPQWDYSLPLSTSASFRTPAVAKSATSNSTLRTPAVSSTTTDSVLRTPGTFSSTPNSTLRTPTGSSTTSNSTLRTPTGSSTTSNSTLRSPIVSSTTSRGSLASNTTVSTPVASELSGLSSELSGLRDQLRTLLLDFSEIPSARSNEEYKTDDFDTVFNQTRLNNCTVCCKGLDLNTTNKSIKKIFSPFGIIEDICLYIDISDYTLIRFNTKEAATLAICSINNTKINGCRVKCTWSNKPTDQNQQAQVGTVSPSPVTPSTQLSFQAACLPFTSSSVSKLSTASVLTKKDKLGGAEKLKEKTTDIFCKICMDEELGVVFLPCGHLTACAKCAEKIHTCPLCRKIITSKVRTYLG